MSYEIIAVIRLTLDFLHKTFAFIIAFEGGILKLLKDLVTGKSPSPFYNYKKMEKGEAYSRFSSVKKNSFRIGEAPMRSPALGCSMQIL